MDVFKIETLSDDELQERLYEVNKRLMATQYINCSQSLIDTLYGILDGIHLEMEVRASEQIIKEFTDSVPEIMMADKGWGEKKEKTSRFSNTPKNTGNQSGTPKIFQKTFRKPT